MVDRADLGLLWGTKKGYNLATLYIFSETGHPLLNEPHREEEYAFRKMRLVYVLVWRIFTPQNSYVSPLGTSTFPPFSFTKHCYRTAEGKLEIPVEIGERPIVYPGSTRTGRQS